MWSLLREAEIGEEAFHATEESRLVPTDGWRLGNGSAWRNVLEALQHAGLRHVWFTVFGLEQTHDDLCGRAGAFAAIMSGLKRCAAVGLQTGVNIVVSVRNAKEIGEIAEQVRALGAERSCRPTFRAGHHWVVSTSRFGMSLPTCAGCHLPRST